MADADALVLEWKRHPTSEGGWEAECCGIDLSVEVSPDGGYQWLVGSHGDVDHWSEDDLVSIVDAQHAAERACGALLDSETVRRLVAKSKEAKRG